MAAANNHADVAATLVEAGAVSQPHMMCLWPWRFACMHKLVIHVYRMWTLEMVKATRLYIGHVWTAAVQWQKYCWITALILHVWTGTIIFWVQKIVTGSARPSCLYWATSRLITPTVLCSHSNTPVDELLGKPYQDEMLALIASYQEQTGNKNDSLVNDNDDEFEEAKQS